VRIDNYADGLVHISQLRDERVETVADAVREGEYVWVVVTDIKEGNKVSLSMRLVDQDTGELKEPLNDVDAATPSARRTGELPQLYSVHKGTVARIQPFGAFVRIDNCRGRRPSICLGLGRLDAIDRSVPRRRRRPRACVAALRVPGRCQRANQSVCRVR